MLTQITLTFYPFVITEQQHKTFFIIHVALVHQTNHLYLECSMLLVL